MKESNYVAPITPTEFELLVKSYLDEIGSDLMNFNIEHNQKIVAHDGTYQIDVLASFEALGGKFTVIIECKHYKSPIEREKVQVLYDKIRALGAHKAMLFSTSGFQEGAIKFAEVHGIALIRMIEGRFTYKTKSMDSPNFEPPEWADVPRFVGEYKTEKYICYLQPGHLDSLLAYITDKPLE